MTRRTTILLAALALQGLPGGGLVLSLATGDRVKLESTELASPEVVDDVRFPSTLVDRPLNTRESITRIVDAVVGARVNGIPFDTP